MELLARCWFLPFVDCLPLYCWVSEHLQPLLLFLLPYPSAVSAASRNYYRLTYVSLLQGWF